MRSGYLDLILSATSFLLSEKLVITSSSQQLISRTKGVIIFEGCIGHCGVLGRGRSTQSRDEVVIVFCEARNEKMDNCTGLKKASGRLESLNRYQFAPFTKRTHENMSIFGLFRYLIKSSSYLREVEKMSRIEMDACRGDFFFCCYTFYLSSLKHATQLICKER